MDTYQSNLVKMKETFERVKKLYELKHKEFGETLLMEFVKDEIPDMFKMMIPESINTMTLNDGIKEIVELDLKTIEYEEYKNAVNIAYSFLDEIDDGLKEHGMDAITSFEIYKLVVKCYNDLEQ